MTDRSTGDRRAGHTEVSILISGRKLPCPATSGYGAGTLRAEMAGTFGNILDESRKPRQARGLREPDSRLAHNCLEILTPETQNPP